MASTFLVGSAVKAGSSKGGRKIIGGICAFCIGLLLLVTAVVSSTISIFVNESGISSDFNAKETEIYQRIMNVYMEYVRELKEEVEQEEAEIRAANMDYDLVEKYNPETQRLEEQPEWYCKATINKSYQYISTSYLMAYLSCIHKQEYLTGNVDVDEEELEEFWDTVGGLRIEREGDDDEPEYYIYNVVMSPTEIAETYFSNEADRQMYLESVYIIGQFIGVESFPESVSVEASNRMDIPLYYQYQAPWGNQSYGNGTISQNGCAPTCIAMVFSYLKGSNITPTDIVQYTKNNYYVNGVGSSWNIFDACASKWSICCSNIGTSADAIVQALSNGNPVVLSMGPGTFTKSGHFIVLTGINESGQVTVNDPNDNSRKNHAGKQFGLSHVISEAKGGWSFY